MVMDIKSLVRGSTQGNISKTGRSGKKGSKAEASAGDGDSGDSVSLTGQASQIGSLIQQMKAAPAVDAGRVDPVKDKVDRDEYEIEYKRVADKMLDFESDYRDY